MHSYTAHLENNPGYKWWVMGIVMIGTLMAMLDNSIVNVSIPAIMADFGASVDDIEWIVTGYMIAFATLMPLTAWLRDRIGYKTLFGASLAVFTVGSLLCGAAWNLPSLICARVIQALGGGAIAPTGMAMISEVFPARERGKAIGIWGMGAIMGPALGPTLGGYLTRTFGWRSIFLVNLPIGIIGLFLAWRVLVHDKPHRSTHRPFDIWGFLFLTAFLVSFLLGLSKGEREGWTSAYIVTCGIIAAVSFVMFLLVESEVSYGIIDISLFESSIFTVCSLISVARSIILFGSIFLIPIYLQQQVGYDELQSGLILMPGSLVIAVIMPFAGRLSDRIGPRIPTVIGMGFLAASMYLYRNIDVIMSLFDIIWPMMVRGVGLGLLMAPIMAAALNAIPNRKAGMASSMLNIIQQVGGSIGIALFTTLLANRATFHLNALGSAVRPDSTAFMEASRRLFERAHDLGYSYARARQISGGMLGRYVAKSAVILSFQDIFIVGTIVAVIGLLSAFALPNRSVIHAGADETGPDRGHGGTTIE